MPFIVVSFFPRGLRDRPLNKLGVIHPVSIFGKMVCDHLWSNVVVFSCVSLSKYDLYLLGLWWNIRIQWSNSSPMLEPTPPVEAPGGTIHSASAVGSEVLYLALDRWQHPDKCGVSSISPGG